VNVGEEMQPSKKGVMMSLTSQVHSMAREEGGVAVCEEEAALGRHRRRRKNEASGAEWAKKAEWAGRLLG
jgi:hypothetical protein